MARKTINITIAQCPECGSTDVVRNGGHKTCPDIKYYRCKQCGEKFNARIKLPSKSEVFPIYGKTKKQDIAIN